MKPSVLARLRAFDRREKPSAGWVAGVDEAGCAPLAGPLVAAAVILFRFDFLQRLNDSKKVTAAERERLFFHVISNSLSAIGIATEEEIDRLNIYHANCLAMKRAVLNLTRTPDLILVDGNRKIDLPVPQKKVIGGDGKSASIAAASIVAKVYRDAWMRHLDGIHPGYGFSNHKGYGTTAHLKCLQLLGPSPVHRKSFAPVRLCMAAAV